MAITDRLDVTLTTEQIINVYKNSGISRPVWDEQRIKKMYENSTLIVTAWDNSELIGVSRALTDFCYCCYLLDLAVSKQYQKQGIRKRLIELTKEKIGNQSMSLLLSAPNAIGYYSKVGLQKAENGFIIKRSE